MERLDVLLKKTARRRRQRLAHFFEVLSLYLEAGLDLAYAWPRAWEALEGNDDFLRMREGESVSAALERLAATYPEPGHALWFSVVGELYGRGAGLRDGVQAAARALRAEQNRALDAHCRKLPMRANVILMIFFLPPTLVLLFAPLLSALLKGF